MPKLTIDLPPLPLQKAHHRATSTGHPTPAAYLLHLLRQDLTRTSPNPPPPASKPSPDRLRRFHQTRQTPRPRMPGHNPRRPRPNQSIPQLRKHLLDSMMSYMKATEDPGHAHAPGPHLKPTRRRPAILDAFLAKLSSRPTPAQSLAAVQRTVLQLNRLNASCDRALIATDQREDLCRLISLAAQRAGLNADHDLTEPWREW